ncbi:3-deoxy-manno-octulosonate cytidylyltransferase [bacterium]|jgi:3-deoxy-manno-octulosonate cytidylyltransferase (CMP-KDO synthetase)|nr:3-deoxy-manno-octulosonate cytidylyltransferase [bacterium]
MGKENKVVAIIPSRLESSRLPGKALLDICGLPMIIHVYKRCLLAKELDEVYVATDNKKIKNIVEGYGGKVIMTSPLHQTGTDRVAEAARAIKADIIVNVQGDEALLNPSYIDKAVTPLYNNPEINVSILVNKFSDKNSISDIKVVLNEKDEVMYFSRADIPSYARDENHSMLKAYHIVPFKRDFLLRYSCWDKSYLEQLEYNEYLRILEKGYKIKAVHVDSDAISVDTQNDLEIVCEKMKNDHYFSLYKNE